jgi:prepilin-type N-terminal cleavage/methylation domain-containing protein
MAAIPPTSRQCVSRSGYTLLEVSIVLGIIALLVGGILTGKVLVRASQLQNMTVAVDKYRKAIIQFRDKYRQLPGDMSNAETFWGSDASCPNTPTNSIIKTATCNGNGDGFIGTSTTASVLSQTTEWFRAWQQLSDAGLIQGQYTGAVGATTTEGLAGVNIPAGKMKGSGWMVYYYLQSATTTTLWGDRYGHLLTFGGYNMGNPSYNPILTPTEALRVDSKIDDGLPGRGAMRARRTAAEPNCTATDTTTQDAATYNATAGDVYCSPIFLLGF